MLWKCTVCNYMHEGPEPLDVCPKCDQPREKFVEIPDADAQKIFQADRTNDIHMEIAQLAMRIKDLAREGMKLNLDPACVGVFKKAHQDAWVIKQRSKAEIEKHVKGGKW